MSDKIPPECRANYEQFRDILSSFLIERIAAPPAKPRHKAKRRAKKSAEPVSPLSHQPASPPPPGPPEPDSTDPPAADDLADFTDYIAAPIFLALPPALQSLTHRAWSDDPHLPTRYPLPLAPDQAAALLQTLDPSIPDSLAAYGITSSPSLDSANPPTAAATEFLTPILSAYLTTLSTPPSSSSSSSSSSYPPSSSSSTPRATACEICARDWVPLTAHHLVPRKVHGKAVRRGWHGAADVQRVAWLCGACHRFVHRFADHETLARELFTVERLLEQDGVRRFAEWVARVRWAAR